MKKVLAMILIVFLALAGWSHATGQAGITVTGSDLVQEKTFLLADISPPAAFIAVDTSERASSYILAKPPEGLLTAALDVSYHPVFVPLIVR